MNATTLARNYDALTPAERFPLIVQANVRADEAEANRLASAAGWLSFRQRDFAPYAEAFRDLADAVFMELLEHALWFAEMELLYTEDVAHDAADEPADVNDDRSEAEDEPDDETGVDDRERSESDRFYDLLLVAGFVLKTKLAAWKLFCERRHVPPFATWEYLPGYKHLSTYFERVERTPGPAFAREGMLRWTNSAARRKGQPERSDADIISPEGAAADLDTLFELHLKRNCG
jgi:hypothetical protein